MKTQLQEKFIERYQHEAQEVYFAPGRVNLIGEHIDYNGGLVMPCAITAGTWLAIAPNTDQLIRFSSLNFPEDHEMPLNATIQKTGSHWFNYPMGVIKELQLAGLRLSGGFDLLFFGNIPIGAGLSSSASIEIVTAFALNQYFKLSLAKLELVKLAKRVENEFIGVSSGIMDQYAVTFGEANKALVLNCDTLKHKTIDCKLGDYVLAVIDTNKTRRLEDSKYNERVAECKAALTALNQQVKLNNLCELTAEKFALHSAIITDETVLKRATHVVKENDRVHLAAKALSENQLETFGRLMYASHQSLRELYEVTGPELDAIVDFCQQYPHVIGARMTGAGFGGCAIALLKKRYEADFAQHLTDYYVAVTGYPATIYVYDIGAGVHQI